jgi:hypothetical protein
MRDAEEALVRKAHANPDIAIDENGTVVERWNHGGDSHWIVGSERAFKGKRYRLLEIRVTAGANFLICKAI